MDTALAQRDPKQVTSALRRSVLNAERCVQRMRLSDIILSVSAGQTCPRGPSQKTLSSPSYSAGMKRTSTSVTMKFRFSTVMCTLCIYVEILVF